MSVFAKMVRRIHEEDQALVDRLIPSSKEEEGAMLNDPPEKAWQAKSRYEIDKIAETQDKDRKFKYIVLLVVSAWLAPLYADYYWWEAIFQLVKKLFFWL